MLVDTLLPVQLKEQRGGDVSSRVLMCTDLTVHSPVTAAPV